MLAPGILLGQFGEATPLVGILLEGLTLGDVFTLGALIPLGGTILLGRGLLVFEEGEFWPALPKLVFCCFGNLVGVSPKLSWFAERVLFDLL